MLGLWILIADDLDKGSSSGRQRSINLQRTSHLLKKCAGFSRLFLHVESGPGKSVSRVLAKGADQRQIVYGDPVQVILKTSNKSPKPEFIMVGTRSRGALERFLFGSVSEEVIARSKVPVFVLGPKLIPTTHQTEKAWKKLKILVPVDFSSASLRQIRKADRLAKQLKAQLILIHSLPTDLHPVFVQALSSSRGRKALEDVMKKERKKAAERLRKMTAKLESPSHFWVSEKVADPYSNILSFQKRLGAGLIVMPIRSRRKKGDPHPVGSQFRAVVARSSVPVLALP